MSPLNNFLNGIREKFNQFLEDLTRVENLDDHLQVIFFFKIIILMYN